MFGRADSMWGNRALIVDGHSDVPMDVVKRRRAGERGVLYRLHLPAWREGGVSAAVLTVAGDEFTDEWLPAYTRLAIQLLQQDVLEYPEELAIVTSSAELVREVAQGRFAIALNLEGCAALDGSLATLKQYRESGLAFATLTWNQKNAVGAGAASGPGDGGLTDFGRQVVLTMAEYGMVADLSHAAPATFWDAVTLNTGNLVVSHSNAAALKPHPRNLSDDQIRALAAQGGYIGVCFYPGFLHSDDPTVEHIIDHIAYIGDLVGIDHVALGPDFIDYVLEDMIAHLKASGLNYGSRFVYPTGAENVRKMKDLAPAMLRRGFAPIDIAKVLGGNLLRVWERIGTKRPPKE